MDSLCFFDHQTGKIGRREKMTFCVGTKKIHIYKFQLLIVFLTVWKLLLMGLFTSDYMERIFVPFVSHFICYGDNPYQYFYEANQTNMFPYPVFMLLMESAGVLLTDIFHVQAVFWCNLLYKLPSLFFDFLGLYFLLKMFPSKKKYVVVFYFASPIIMYAVYMHGQLDIIPTALFLGALYYMSYAQKRNYVVSGIFLTAALLSKLHILAVLPIVFIYLYKKETIRTAVRYACGVALGVAVGILAFLSPGFVNLVLLNSEQGILTQIVFDYTSVQVYIPIAAVVFVYLIAFGVNLMNKELLFSFCGVVFAVFLALCPPMPGWYVWIVPFIAFFLTNVDMGKYKNSIIYMLLNGLYLIYFIFFHTREYVDLYCLGKDLSFLKVDHPVGENLLFTLLTVTLLYIIFELYQLGVASNSLYKRRNMPFTIGIAGDSGSGKSTLTGIITDCLGEQNLLFLEGDGDHRWERHEEQWNEYTHLNPKANFLYRQAAQLQQLRYGVNVKRVEYDHDSGRFTTARKIHPKKYVVLCGLHSLYLPQTRKNLDLKIYMDIDEELRRYWKMERDMDARGYSREAIADQIEGRTADAAKYIYPQKKYADVLIRYYDKELIGHEKKESAEEISVKLTISAAIDIEPLVDELKNCGIRVSCDYTEDLTMQTVDIAAEDIRGVAIDVKRLASRLIPQVDELTTELNTDGEGLTAILQLFLLLIISDKMQNADN